MKVFASADMPWRLIETQKIFFWFEYLNWIITENKEQTFPFPLNFFNIFFLLFFLFLFIYYLVLFFSPTPFGCALRTYCPFGCETKRKISAIRIGVKCTTFIMSEKICSLYVAHCWRESLCFFVDCNAKLRKTERKEQYYIFLSMCI